jgi:hypothetical protein
MVVRFLPGANLLKADEIDDENSWFLYFILGYFLFSVSVMAAFASGSITL